MKAKRYTARLTLGISALVFTAGITAGAYYDAGGWPAVAIVWGASATVMGLSWALAWAVENWNA